MANQEQLRFLKGVGVSAWNEWRKENSDIKIDLSGADLTGAHFPLANFSSADLQGAILPHAYLSNTNFAGANLSSANLVGADLPNANFIGADLTSVDFFRANLFRANLSNAVLFSADIHRVTLFNTNLSRARFGDTSISHCDLRNVQGLKTIRHGGPSSIDIDTIYRSKGKIPHIFLHGCGVPDSFIEYMASLTGQAFEFYSVFISYSDKNRDVAKRIHADLQDNGVRCWFAPHDMQIGQKVRPTIQKAIRLYDKLLLILSEDAIQSDWVEDEVETALEKERASRQEVLFPIRIDDAVMDSAEGWATTIKRRHIGDFRNWENYKSYQVAFDRLLKDLRSEKPSNPA